jgi:hypothetical protein
MQKPYSSHPEKLMIRKTFPMVVPLILALIVAFGERWQMQAEDSGKDNKRSYPSMAPLEQYLMPRDAEIALARSAAPRAISRDATVLVLGRKGYETAVKGENGFVCVVERSWGADFDDSEFWNPKIRGAVCYNPPAARSVFPARAKRQEMILAGLSKTQVFDGIKTAFDRKELPNPEPGSMCYMMSKEAYLNDRGRHDLAHLMFEVPRIDDAAWGANLPNSPVLGGAEDPEPFSEFIVPVGKWSDGTAAPTK